MSCATCRPPTPAQAHCATCHRTFGGVTGFDAHRKDAACLDPAGFGYVERDGVWRTPMTDEARERLYGGVA
ncbi:hypothetical protein [Plantactinospora sp. WMMB782]|uniref:FDXHR family putative zinc-binding protein n=1 Tax=Plantactinospora sp. WMMB782 TaxID=3404121 RepID=UPI003B933405